jgi:predicted PurR-regulated permease PerM
MLMPLLGILTVLATITALKLARELMLPIVVALLLSLIMSPVVRALRRRRIPEHLGAAVVVFGTVALAAGAAFAVAGPASDFFAKAPETLAAAQQRLQAIARPLEAFQRTAERVEAATTTASTSPIRARVEIAPEGFLARWSGGTLTALVSAFSAVFLTYFLLASGPMFRKKIADALPSRFERARFASLFDEIELVTSRFLGLSLMINAGVAVATAIALVIAGMPNPFLWGTVAGALNFIPYLGAYTTLALITVTAISLPDPSGRLVFAPLMFLVIHLTESNLVTPWVLGRRLPLSPIAIFTALIFWGWLWGIPGAVVAVPLTVVIKVACDHLPGMERFGALLND